MMRVSYFFWIIGIFLIVVLTVEHSVNLFSGIKEVTGEGVLVFEQKIGWVTPTTGAQFGQKYLGWENFSKKDLLFVAWYRLRLNLGKEIKEKVPDLNISFELPGKIIKHNATRIEKGTAIWESLPPDGILVLETRLIRWWLIILTGSLGFLGFWLGRRKTKEIN